MPLPTPNNRVRESCSTTGTGNLACGGNPTGYTAFGSRYADGDRFKYCCAGGAEWEVALGEYDAPTNSIIRITCSQSSNGDAFVPFTVGSKFVWVDRDAKDDPAIPGDATLFLNGATPPAYAAVKDSDLSTSDVTTNNVTSSKHGFAPKAPNDVTKFLDGTGSWSVPAPAVPKQLNVVIAERFI